MDDPIFIELRKLVGQHEKIVYEAVKADTVAQLPHESQLFAKASPMRSRWEANL